MDHLEDSLYRGGTFVGLSGGVDSSTTALLLKEKGERPVGLYMFHPFQPTLTEEEMTRFWEESPECRSIPVFCRHEDGSFTSERWRPDLFPFPRDGADAVRMARFLGIPIVVYDVSREFVDVTGNFVSEYLAGRTPNPCALCNRILKFGRLIELAIALGGEFFATGHYVRIVPHADWRKNWRKRRDESSLAGEGMGEGMEDERTLDLPDWLANRPSEEPALLRAGGGGIVKDQSYVLYGIDRRNLPRLRFPLGDYSKEVVRQIAAKRRLPVAEKKESQDVCFIPDGAIPEFIRSQVGELETAGNFVSTSGKVMGRHSGYERFTVGQRKGFGVGFGERVFVQRIDAATKEVVLGSREELGRTEVVAIGSRWLLDVPKGEPFRAEVKIRYRTPPVAAEVTVSEEGTIYARLDEPRYGVAPGQSLVCYWGDRLLGGGVLVEEGTIPLGSDGGMAITKNE